MGATPQQRPALKSRKRWPLFVVLAVLAGGLTVWTLSGSVPQVLRLRALSDEYARLTAGYKPDRSAYPLPKLEKGQAELAYLQAVNQRLASAGGDCLAAERDLRRLFENNQAERRGSIFLPAAQAMACSSNFR